MELRLINHIEVYEISDGVKKLSKKEKLKLANELFKERYQKKIITLQFLSEEHFVRINADTRLHFSFKNRKEEYSEYFKRIEMAADGKYKHLILNSKYEKSTIESKVGQNEKHLEGQKYHYFSKLIIIDGEEYEVIIDVKERNDGIFLVHQTSLRKK